MTPDAERYFRDLYDHLIRISDLVDSYRDLLSGVLDTHLSTVSNRLNVVMKQLTIIATIFLPLELPDRVLRAELRLDGEPDHQPAGLPGPGIGLQVAVAVALVVVFRRRGWLYIRRHRAASQTRGPATCDTPGAVAPGAAAEGTA